MEDLENFAKKVAMDFSSKYRTARNPDGKECIIVHGGDFESRENFAYVVRSVMPSGVNAYVVEQECKRVPGERGDGEEVFYVDMAKVGVSY